jgi:hypothetical protein
VGEHLPIRLETLSSNSIMPKKIKIKKITVCLILLFAKPGCPRWLLGGKEARTEQEAEEPGSPWAMQGSAKGFQGGNQKKTALDKGSLYFVNKAFLAALRFPRDLDLPGEGFRPAWVIYDPRGFDASWQFPAQPLFCT